MCDLGRAEDPGDDEAPSAFGSPWRPPRTGASGPEMRVQMFGKRGVSGLADILGIAPRTWAPDKITIARVSAELASRGSLGIQTLPAVPITGFIVKLTSKD